MTLYVAVSKRVIEQNLRTGRNDPPYEIYKHKRDRDPLPAHEAVFRGVLRLVYNVKEPLCSGAVCWLEIDED